jgi:hypothetical protein
MVSVVGCEGNCALLPGPEVMACMLQGLLQLAQLSQVQLSAPPLGVNQDIPQTHPQRAMPMPRVSLLIPLRVPHLPAPALPARTRPGC